MELIFVGQNISSEYLVNTLKYVENKKFAINIVNKNGSTLEPSIAFREFRKLLETKIGSELAKKLIIVTTDAKRGILSDLAKNKSYEILALPENISVRFGAFSVATLFPILCAGADINSLLNGAKYAIKMFHTEDFYKNDIFLYSASRHYLAKTANIELFTCYEKRFMYIGE
ncbi:UNVERIFIED_CONTAM: hypothetical protein O8I53_11260 [Campylobacter lari]